MSAIKTHEASCLLINFKRSNTPVDILELENVETTILEYVNPYRVIRIAFTTLKNKPELIRVSSTNWAYEDEPRGLYDIVACRKFYKQLLDFGFTVNKD